MQHYDKKPRSPKKLHHIEIHPAENKGHTVTHHFHSGDGNYHEPKEHVFSEDEGHEMLAHVANHLHIPAEFKKEEEAEGESEG